MNSVLDKSQLEFSRKDVFGQVIAEPLDEAHTSLRANSSAIDGAAPASYLANASHSRPYFGEVFESFQTLYWPIHCVIGLVICSVGIIANLINVIVLTRPNMISAVNTILCAIACSDLIVNVSNIPYLMHELADSSNLASYYSYNWAHYILVHAHLTVTLHTISIWLTCALATLRYCVLRSTYGSSQTYSVGTALRVIFGVVVLVPVFCIPNYLSFDIVNERTKSQIVIYKVGFSSLAEDSQFIKTSHFWIFSCLTKLLPCLLLTYFTSVLIKLLARARERRLRLSNLAESSAPPVDSRSTPTAAMPNGHKRNRRKTADNPQQVAARNPYLKGHRPSIAAEENGHGNNKPVANGFKGGRADLLSSQSSALATGQVDTTSSRLMPDGRSPNLDHEQQQQQQQQFVDEAQNEHPLDSDGSVQLKRGDLRQVIGSQRLASGGSGSRGMANMTSTTSDRDEEPAAVDVNNVPDQHSKSNNNLSCQLAAHSGSSCATDAECFQVTGSVSSDGSSSDKIDQAVQQQQPSYSSLAPPQRPQQGQQQQQQQHLAQPHHLYQHQQPVLVETMPTSSATSTATTTRMLMIGNEVVGINVDGSAPLDNGDNGRQREVDLLDKCQGSLGQRSASTGGALELYAINNEAGNGTESRLTKASSAKQNQCQKQDSLEDHIGAEKCPKKSLGANRSGSANDEHSPEGLTATLLDQTNRPRSIGSASFAPLQIVRFQATHRQLSQNETTTRLLIAVIIVFLICEFPAGILAALCAVLGQDFFDNVYQPMGTFTDLLALINSSVNFMIYCFMSTQFRVTFYRVVLHCPAPREINTNNR